MFELALLFRRNMRQVEEPRVAAVQQAESVDRRRHLEFGPGHTVDHHDVEEGLRVPDGRDVGAGLVEVDVETGPVLPGTDGVCPSQPLEEGPVGRVEQRTVSVEGAVLDDDGDLADTASAPD